MKYCQWPHEVGSDDPTERGLKELALVSQAGVPTLPAFIVTPEVFEGFFEVRTLASAIHKRTSGLSSTEQSLFSGVAKAIRSEIAKTKVPVAISTVLSEYLEELRTRLLKTKNSKLRLRLVFLGTESVELVKEVANVAQLEVALKQLFILLFTESDLAARYTNGTNPMPESASILVQWMPVPAIEGEAFSHDLTMHDDTTIEIHAWPYKKPSAGQLETQDAYRVDKKSFTILSQSIQKRWWAEHGNGRMTIPPTEASHGTLTPEQVIQLARLIKQADTAVRAEGVYNWIYSDRQFFITAVESLEDSQMCDCFGAEEQTGETPLLQGLPASLGQAYGPVRCIKKAADWKKLESGEVVVVEHLTEAHISHLDKAVALIVESGTHRGIEAQLAQASMLPAVVGVGTALADLKDGQVVTIDGSTGAIWAGVHKTAPQPVSGCVITGTKLWTSVVDPYVLDEAAVRASDGIGILRGEFIIRMLGLHPHDVLRQSRATEYKEILSEGIMKALRAAHPRPVIYQLHDVSSFDLIGLRPKHEERHEPNPALGYRGAHRLLSEPELLELELEVLAGLIEHGGDNLAIMIPMARTVGEVEKMLRLIGAAMSKQHHEIQVWVKCETPGLTVLIEDMCHLPIAGVCFDAPAIAQLMQGIDRENRQIGHHLDTGDQAVAQALDFAIRTCRGHGIATMIVAEQEHLHPEIIQVAVEAGLTGVSVASNEVESTRHLLATIEQRLLLDHVLDEHPIAEEA